LNQGSTQAPRICSAGRMNTPRIESYNPYSQNKQLCTAIHAKKHCSMTHAKKHCSMTHAKKHCSMTHAKKHFASLEGDLGAIEASSHVHAHVSYRKEPQPPLLADG
jgi:hypothetical protein